MQRLLVCMLLVCGCKKEVEAPSSGPGTIGASSFCGDGVVDASEDCDDGDANSDLDADACRTTCNSARCGDGIQDSVEACDDANSWGGDGCLPSCEVEAGPYESEPNDDSSLANALPEGGEVAGSLPAFDRDCYALEVAENGWVEAQMLPDASGICAYYGTIELVDASGDSVAVGFPDETTGCGTLTPEDGSRYLNAGTYGLCVEGLFNGEVPAYRLSAASEEDSCILTIVPTADEDYDLDGLANNCDDDLDGDGVHNGMDNCPSLSNGPSSVASTPNEDGYIGTWLELGPFEEAYSPYSCMPDFADRLNSDSQASPQLGDVDDGQVWTARIEREDRMDFATWFPTAAAPREVYVISYVYSATQQSVELRLGHDDGARAWLNQQLIVEQGTCQGAWRDAYSYPVTLNAGWNTLLFRIYDGGGGWALYARFHDGSNPVTDLQLSLTPNTSQVFTQSDQDQDGVGDICDPTP